MFFFFSSWNQGPGPRRGRVYPAVLRYVLCVCDLWPLRVKQQRQCGMFFRRGGWGGAFIKSEMVDFHLASDHCSLRHLYTRKKKISNWNVRFNCPLCCLQLAVILQMKPLEKSHFWLHVYWSKWKISRNSLRHLHYNVCWCALQSWLCLVAVSICLIPVDQRRCSHFFSRYFQQLCCKKVFHGF